MKPLKPLKPNLSPTGHPSFSPFQGPSSSHGVDPEPPTTSMATHDATTTTTPVVPSSYPEILDELLLLCQTTMDGNDPASKLLARHERRGVTMAVSGTASTPIELETTLELLPFRPEGLTDVLAVKLLCVKDDDGDDGDVPMPDGNNHNHSEDAASGDASVPMEDDSTPDGGYLSVARALLEAHPATYLPALAASVKHLVAARPTISPSRLRQSGILRLWVSLMTHADSVAIHETLSSALLSLLRLLEENRNQDDDGDDNDLSAAVAAHFVQDWKALLAKNKDRDAQLQAVRCAVVLLRWIATIGTTSMQASGATEVFVTMLGNFDDPLQQISLLDALAEVFGNDGDATNSNDTDTMMLSTNATSIPSDAQAWLAAPPILSIVQQCLPDPLLSAAALSYLGVVSVSRPTELGWILDHVRRIATEGIPTRDTERLPLVHAVSRVASSSAFGLDAVLGNAQIRNAWWNLDRLSQPNLKAAILVSVAQALPAMAEVSSPSRALKAYRTMGEDHLVHKTNSALTTTTQWLLESFLASPIPPVRIASWTLLAAALRIPGAAPLLIGDVDRTAHEGLVRALVSEPSWEPLPALRLAKYDGLEALMEALEAHPALEANPKTLQRLRDKHALGPHGRKPLRYDEPATSS